ncbi:MAG: sugar phosphate isomerase/epimerase [Clostridia bacterium]|nr:sugar phosphate isomerase/epimerase [Clostridia bacterium]MBN2882723.1 sugar phosphate isomerase/epimerase [Clostridia bacterium]
MKIAIDSFSFYKHLGKHWYIPRKSFDIKWYCEKCRSLGADGLHIDPYHIDINRDMDWVMDFAGRNDMYVEIGACGTTYEELISSIDAAKKHGIKILRTFIGGSCLDNRDEIKKRVREAKINLLEPLKAAENADVTIAIENHGDIFIEDLVSLMEIDSGNLGICFDSGNFAFTGEDPLHAVEIFKDKIVCTHLKDVCAADEYPNAKPFQTVNDPVHFCTIGKGILPMSIIIQSLINSGLEKITLEICTSVIPGLTEKNQLETEVKAVEESMEYMRRSNTITSV